MDIYLPSTYSQRASVVYGAWKFNTSYGFLKSYQNWFLILIEYLRNVTYTRYWTFISNTYVHIRNVRTFMYARGMVSIFKDSHIKINSTNLNVLFYGSLSSNFDINSNHPQYLNGGEHDQKKVRKIVSFTCSIYYTYYSTVCIVYSKTLYYIVIDIRM